MSVHVYPASDDGLTRLFVEQHGRGPVPGDALVTGNTRWVMQNGGTWAQEPVAAIRFRREHR